MGQSTGSTSTVHHCEFDGCSNDVVCVEVYVRYRRESLYEGHRLFCATHAVSEGIRLRDNCMCDTVHGELQELAPLDMGGSVAADICRSYQ